MTTSPTHEQKVARIAAALKEAHDRGSRVDWRKRSVSHFVPNPFVRDDDVPRVDVRDLDEVLEIDAEARTCRAESGVTFADLTRETLRHGLIPKVVPELKGITVGGAVSGCSLESMSYKVGGFHDSCLAYEVITGAGEVRTLSREQAPELFEAVHGSYGTLAFVAAVTFELIPAKPYVRMEYRHHATYVDFWADMTARIEKDDFDFVDGIIHGPDHFTLCLGRMVDDAPKVSRYDWLEIYYKSTASLGIDHLTTWDYFFRYDAECHWLSRTVPPMEWKPVRFALGKLLLGSDNLVTWSDRLAPVFRRALKRPDVVVDVFIPGRSFQDFFEWYAEAFDFWPLWIVPYGVKELYPFISDEHQARIGDERLLIDAAVYGKPNSEPGVDYSELIERKTYELDGIKTLISQNHYDEATFWSIYSKPRWEAAKRELDPKGVFAGLYERFSSNRK